MYKAACGLLFSLVSLAISHASTISVAPGGNDTVNWGATTAPFPSIDLQIDTPGSLIISAFSLNGLDWGDGSSSIQLDCVFPAVAINDSSMGSGVLGANAIIGGDLTYWAYDGDFPPFIFFSLDADPASGGLGTNNYMGFYIEDTSSQRHYGWLQFELYSYDLGSPGLRFITGYIYDTPNASIAAGAIPEPSMALLLGAGLLPVAGLCRRWKTKS